MAAWRARPVARALGVAAVLTILGLVSAPAASAQRQGKAGPLTWQVSELRVDRRVVDGAEQDVHVFTLVVRNTGSRTLQVQELADTARLLPGAQWSVEIPLVFECLAERRPCSPPLELISQHDFVARDEDGSEVRWRFEAAHTGRAPGPARPPMTLRAPAGSAAVPRGIVPIRLVNNLVFVDVLVNDKSVRLLLDTGAQITVVSAAAARLDITPAADGPRLPVAGVGAHISDVLIAVADSLRVGDYVFEHPRLGIASQLIFSVDGVLGSDLLALFRVTIDRKARTLLLELNQ